MDFFINMADVRNHWSSTEHPNAVSGTDWPATLAALAAKQTGTPAPGRVEINSHGGPGRIKLQPEVNLSNVGQFAGLIRRLVGSGSLIEILACNVAYYPWRMTNSIANDWVSDRHRALTFEVYKEKREAEITDGEVVTFAKQAMRMGRSRTLLGDNGPMFCAALATATASRVRAGLYIQREERELSGNAAFAIPIGNWEGHVLDFLPGDVVRYAGFNLPRLIFRTHDEHGDGPLRAA